MKSLLLLLIPVVAFAGPKPGTLDHELVNKVIKAHVGQVKTCYVSQLKLHPGLQGKVTAKFRISIAGTVESANASGVSEEVSSCIAKLIRGMEFPPPTGGYVDVTYPFVFSSQG